MSELADEHDLGSCAERRGGSNPPFPTRRIRRLFRKLLCTMVGVRGLEPPTSASQTLRANQLRHTPLPKILILSSPLTV